jgi:hypothetical protein
MADKWTTNTPSVLGSFASGVATYSLDSSRGYTATHLSVDSLGSAATGTIILFLDRSGSFTNDTTAAANKLILKSGESIVFGPGCATLECQSLSGDPMFQVIPGEYRI